MKLAMKLTWERMCTPLRIVVCMVSVILIRMRLLPSRLLVKFLTDPSPTILEEGLYCQRFRLSHNPEVIKATLALLHDERHQIRNEAGWIITALDEHLEPAFGQAIVTLHSLANQGNRYAEFSLLCSAIGSIGPNGIVHIPHLLAIARKFPTELGKSVGEAVRRIIRRSENRAEISSDLLESLTVAVCSELLSTDRSNSHLRAEWFDTVRQICQKLVRRADAGEYDRERLTALGNEVTLLVIANPRNRYAQEIASVLSALSLEGEVFDEQ